MVTKTKLPNYNLSYKTQDLLKELGNKISQRNFRMDLKYSPLNDIFANVIALISRKRWFSKRALYFFNHPVEIIDVILRYV